MDSRIFLKSAIICMAFFVSTNAYSQCYPDRHNTNLSSAWVSCSTSSNPNSKRNRGHWILYDIQNMQAINSLNIWNINHPDYIDYGAKLFVVDYTDINGMWKEHGIYSLDAAEGSSFYEGQQIELTNDIISDKILITILENYGGACTGISEIRFGLRQVTTATEDISDDHFDISIAPNPFGNYTTIEIANLKGKSVVYQLSNSLGQIVLSEFVNTTQGHVKFGINGKHLSSGNYFLKIIDGQKVSVRKLSHQFN